ncbi:MAG: potassium channel family protein [Woeseia sp.]|nr:potassium channel family protein [Woeseia sp.]
MSRIIDRTAYYARDYSLPDLTLVIQNPAAVSALLWSRYRERVISGNPGSDPNSLVGRTPHCRMSNLTKLCRELYYGDTPRAMRARFLFLVFDILVVSYFVATTFLELQTWIIIVDMAIGVILTVELAGRLLADSDRGAFLTKPMTVLDFIVIASLFVPALIGNFAFLRLVRSLRLLRSYTVARKLRSQSRFFARNEEVIFSVLNLLIFIFIVTAAVFVLQVKVNSSINNYVDALYFTITTLTTTGFGDVTLVGSAGRLLAVVIMIVGVALFIRLVQTIFRPNRIHYECPDCGLTRHELDAVHCKHCGRQLHIRTDGLVD